VRTTRVGADVVESRLRFELERYVLVDQAAQHRLDALDQLIQIDRFS
jgi:hypothetical protein